MNSLFKYIENNLPSELDAGSLSRAGYVSHAQLYRDFYNLTGHSVKEYIRKRRLSNALALIKASCSPLADIAYQCGYSSQQTFCRAVKQTLGMTPLKYKDGDMYYFYPPYDGEPVQNAAFCGAVTLTSKTIPQTVCLRFYHSSIKYIENKAINTFLKLFPDYNGRIFGRNGKQNGSRFCYELYLTDVDQDYTVLKDYGYKLSKITAPFTATFASSTVKNDEDKINAAWNYLYHTWLQNSMFEYTNDPYYEEYILKGGSPLKLKLYLPIKKRADETKITLINDPGLCFIITKAKGYNAEKIASKTVIDYLSENYPYIVKTSKEFYLRKEIYSCVCGVKINSELRIKDVDNVENMTTNKGSYLMLTSSVMGDYDRYANLLLSFAHDNGMIADKRDIFSVYDAKESFENPKIRMYCPVNFETK
ncbi:MAG: hypothetical protein A2Y17_04910 [Clostridiales bacterium GWF2_38_85]|nr:MAG: hypothetical protein A2Y17_04910 [Clostridiales bacterium GWF2_38_85]HBL84372.1 hypothetical protein [Clostridiales bacterium]